MSRRIVTPAIAGALVVVCGCGGATSNGIARLTAAQALAKTRAAVGSVRTVHVHGTVIADGKPIGVDVHDKVGGGTGTLHIAGGTLRLVRAGSTIYVKGDVAGLQATGASPQQAAEVAGKWLEAPASSATLGSFAGLLDARELLDDATSPTGSVKAGVNTTVAGQPAYTLIDSAVGGNGVLYVARHGKPLVLQVDQPGSTGGRLDFDDYNASVVIVAPKGAIDLSQVS